ncbi:Cu2+-exporting ATPase [Paucidesulfovibrio gracilis DSM 16080]|uniref:P-type Zn(2+) transporter n=1 Tax=Paucidesulfovibrio gracilis DSM 16080 TaxID=1121449 RepID=A0A1T4W258_9BACT|nr:heavy metal translocating P-type ATPase [Paucidesulfovibrio gracilis]SKA71336.1 Cu2+-exporting ATPase [Paucidesulfovibrio gracilis DSM 16080]
MSRLPSAARARVVHETPRRLRFRWNGLLAPDLNPEYLRAWFGNFPGVREVRVNAPGRTLVVEYDGLRAHRQAICNGFSHVPDQAFDQTASTVPNARGIDALFHTGLAGMVPFFPPALQATVAGIMGISPMLRGIDTLLNQGLKARVLDMTTVGASLLRSDYVTASSIAAMVVVGDYLRGMSDDRSNTLLKSLIAAPVENVRVERGGEEQDVGFDDVRVGDVVLCSGGELVPVDGQVVRGEAMVDLSGITGESAPGLLRAGDEALSGSVVVEGSLGIVARTTGRDTSMVRIAEFMTRAVTERSDAENKSTRLADALAPLTLGLGAAIYAATGDMERALSVLTVDFACAVKFPAPVVIKTSMYSAARQGVIFKSGNALEALAEVDAIVFDKTGTVTRGELSVTDILLAESESEDALLRLAAAVEDRFGHPIGRGIVREAARRGLTPPKATDLDLNVAHGVGGMVDGEQVRVGSRHFIQDDCGVDCSVLAEATAALRSQGKSLVYVSRGTTLQGVAALKDSVREEAGAVMTALRACGVRKMVMLTGDHAATTRRLRERLPALDEVRAELTPDQKAAAVRSLQDQGWRVAVVGDGVNDAPAFTAADVGVCMSRSTGLARESAHIVLDRDSLNGLVTARLYAQRVERILQYCFNAGVGVNLGLLGAAGAGLLRPVVAAGVHNANTFAILGLAAWASSREITS